MDFQQFLTLNEALKNSKMVCRGFEFELSGVPHYSTLKTPKGKDFESYDLYYKGKKIGNISNAVSSVDKKMSDNGKYAVDRKQAIRWNIKFEKEIMTHQSNQDYASKQAALDNNIPYIIDKLKAIN